MLVSLITCRRIIVDTAHYLGGISPTKAKESLRDTWNAQYGKQIIGDVSADGASDQIIVVSNSDQFSIKTAKCTDNSSQFIGLVPENVLRGLVDKHYGPRE